MGNNEADIDIDAVMALVDVNGDGDVSLEVGSHAHLATVNGSTPSRSWLCFRKLSKTEPTSPT